MLGTSLSDASRLKDFKASELGGLAGKAALAELPTGVEVDQVFFG